jgi:integrase
MDKRAWPTGIRPSGAGIQIRIFQSRKCIHYETIAGDPYKKSDLAAAVKRRDLLESRKKLGLPLSTGALSKTRDVASAAQSYLNSLDAKRTTHLSYENILNQYWIPTIGHWPVTDVDQTIIEKILNSLMVIRRSEDEAPKSLSAKTKKNILQPLRGLLEHERISPNPAEGIKFRKQQQPKVERYKPEQRDALLACLDGQTRLYFALLFGCGLRPCGEPLSLQWPDYDGEMLEINKQMTKRKLEDSTKTSVRRSVYVPTWVRTLLNAHYTRFEGGHIFLNQSGSAYLDTDVFNSRWKAAHKKCKIPYRTPYKCRHTRASELLSIGIDPADAAKQMGHSLEMFLRTYAEFIEEFSKNKDRSRFEGVGPKQLSVG